MKTPAEELEMLPLSHRQMQLPQAVLKRDGDQIVHDMSNSKSPLSPT